MTIPPPSANPDEALVLTQDQEGDLLGLLTWAFMTKPGIPWIGALPALWTELNRRDRAR